MPPKPQSTLSMEPYSRLHQTHRGPFRAPKSQFPALSQTNVGRTHFTGCPARVDPQPHTTTETQPCRLGSSRGASSTSPTLSTQHVGGHGSSFLPQKAPAPHTKKSQDSSTS